MIFWQIKLSPVGVESWPSKNCRHRIYIYTYKIWGLIRTSNCCVSMYDNFKTFQLIVALDQKTLLNMLCTAQLPGPVLKAFGWVQISPFQMADKPPMITDQLTAGGSVSQLSQLAKLSPWLTLSTKDITTSFWHYKKLFCFLSNQIMGLYHFSNPIK